MPYSFNPFTGNLDLVQPEPEYEEFVLNSSKTASGRTFDDLETLIDFINVMGNPLVNVTIEQNETFSARSSGGYNLDNVKFSSVFPASLGGPIVTLDTGFYASSWQNGAIEVLGIQNNSDTPVVSVSGVLFFALQKGSALLSTVEPFFNINVGAAVIFCDTAVIGSDSISTVPSISINDPSVFFVLNWTGNSFFINEDQIEGASGTVIQNIASPSPLNSGGYASFLNNALFGQSTFSGSIDLSLQPHAGYVQFDTSSWSESIMIPTVQHGLQNLDDRVAANTSNITALESEVDANTAAIALLGDPYVDTNTIEKVPYSFTGPSATLGSLTSFGGSSSSSPRTITSQFTATESMKITKIEARVGWNSTMSDTMGAVIYDDNGSDLPGDLIAVGQEKTVSNTSNDIEEFTFSGANQIELEAGDKFFPGVRAADNSARFSWSTINNDTNATVVSDANDFPNAPLDPFGTPAYYQNGIIALRVTYTTIEDGLQVIKQMSIDADGSGVKLVSDEASPGNNKVYGTDGSGTKGWKNGAVVDGSGNIVVPAYAGVLNGSAKVFEYGSYGTPVNGLGAEMAETGNAPVLYAQGSDTNVDLALASKGTGLIRMLDGLVIIGKTPSSASDTGRAGEIAWDSDYIYICTDTDTWKRTSISTW